MTIAHATSERTYLIIKDDGHLDALTLKSMDPNSPLPPLTTEEIARMYDAVEHIKLKKTAGHS